jgi:4'-phosphopantetheinyl transferase
MIAREAVWNPAPDKLRLGDEVHIWRASLNQPAAMLTAFKQSLATEELERAAKFHFQKDRDHFIVARALLRIILASYLESKPEQLRFSFNEYGKPALADTETVRFNLSHSRDLVLYAVARNRELGVDVEYVRDDFDTAQIARQFFSRREIEALCALPPEQQEEGFFLCWTRKEAYIKAKGQGLSIPLDQFDVSLAPDEPAKLLNVAGDTEEISRWSLRELAPGPGYMAAIAVEGSDWRLSCFQWTGASPDALAPASSKILSLEEP